MIRLLCLCLFVCADLQAQDYVIYQTIFNRVDEDILADNTDMAMLRLDTLNENYKFIYARHAFKALQVCAYANDSIRADKWLFTCFRQGVPLWIIRKHELGSKALSYSICAHTVNAYDSIRNIYHAAINKEVATEIDALLKKDQKKTNRVNDGFFIFRHTFYGLQWINNNRKQFRKIQAITTKYGFPGERLIGLSPEFNDSATMSQYLRFTNRVMNDERAYVMLVHYYSRPGKDMDKQLQDAVHNGNMPARQYGTLCDYRVRYGKEKPGKYNYYYVWRNTDIQESFNIINNRRQLMGLHTYEQQQRNIGIEDDRLKAKKMTKKIILE